MKVLIINYALSTGGISKVIKDISQFYDKSKIDLYIATIEKGLWDKEIDNNIVEHFYFEKIKEKYTIIDKILKHFFHKSLYKTLEEEFDICIVFKEGFYDFMQYVKAKKYILWVHEDYAYNKLKSLKGAWWRLPILLHLKKKYLKKYDAIVACSENSKESYEKYHKIKGVQTITNSINQLEVLEHCNDKIDLPDNIKNNYIVNVNSIRVEKRVDLLVDLFNECLKRDSNLNLVIIGDGNCEDLVINKINDYGISDKCLLLGEIYNPASYIKNAKLMVSTSGAEAYGLAVAESMFLGVPAVCFYNRGIDGFVKSGVNSVIVNNNEDFVNEVLKVCCDEKYRQYLSENAKKDMRELADIKGYVRKVEDFIFKVYNQEL